MKEVTHALAWGGGILVLALAASLARKQGYIDDEMTKRVVIGATGLMIAAFGNRLPKTMAPSAFARQVQRVGGWALVLSGLVYAGVWAFAPIPVAVTVGCLAVAAGMAVTLGYCLWLRRRASAA